MQALVPFSLRLCCGPVGGGA